MADDQATAGNATSGGEWATAQADNGGLPLIVRLRKDLGAADMRSRWPNRMVVLWRFPPEGEQGKAGLPTPDQQAAMDRFEDAVDAGLAASGVAVLTSVATRGGQREWIWYCGATVDFNRAFNAALRGHPKYPLALQVGPDPAWRNWQALLKAFGVSPS
jgi:hypothetical protein